MHQQVLDRLQELSQLSTREPPWEELQSCFIYKRIPKNRLQSSTCGKILAHARQQVHSFREKLGVDLCVFKIGITAFPAQRFQQYWCKAFTMMWIIYMADDLSLINMLEAALIGEFNHLRGCRNMANTGGEGGLMRSSQNSQPPYYVYVTGGRADQLKRVG